MITYWHGLDLLSQSDGTDAQHFQYDGLGSVRQLTDEAGAVLYVETFDPYGNLYVSAGAEDQTNHAFTGEMQDTNGLLFLRARYYSAGTGRFFQTDPSRQETNPYLYSYSNPLNFTDPSGHCATCKTEADFAQYTLYQLYGLPLHEFWRFSDEERIMIYETVKAYADLLGGPQRFKANVALTGLESEYFESNAAYNAVYVTWEGPKLPFHSIALPPNWFKDVMEQPRCTDSGDCPPILIPLDKCIGCPQPGPVWYQHQFCQSDVEKVLNFPEGSLVSDRNAAMFVLAHEMGHAFAVGDPEALDSFVNSVHFTLSKSHPNPIIARNSGRRSAKEEIFSDVIAAYLFAPGLLYDDMIDWVENSMPDVLR